MFCYNMVFEKQRARKQKTATCVHSAEVNHNCFLKQTELQQFITGI